ncbi:MAG: glycogen debranching enzyme N-terminal domain-containing protein, partial [Candidatus Omnitrophica bacterium]|nr:glycogen debranching enzyme N-terminal domain-containing protein [Candidatus Omnitrophota bacterium]
MDEEMFLIIKGYARNWPRQKVFADQKTGELDVPQGHIRRVELSPNAATRIAKPQEHKFSNLHEALSGQDKTICANIEEMHRLEDDLAKLVDVIKYLDEKISELSSVQKKAREQPEITRKKADEMKLLFTRSQESFANSLLASKTIVYHSLQVAYRLAGLGEFRAISRVLSLAARFIERRLVDVRNIAQSIWQGRLKELRALALKTNAEVDEKIEAIINDLSSGNHVWPHRKIMGLLNSKKIAALFSNPEYEGMSATLGYAHSRMELGTHEEVIDILKDARHIAAHSRAAFIFNQEFRDLYVSENLNGKRLGEEDAFESIFISYLKKRGLNKASPQEKLEEVCYWWTRFFMLNFVSLSVENPAERSCKIPNPLFGAIKDFNNGKPKVIRRKVSAGGPLLLEVDSQQETPAQRLERIRHNYHITFTDPRCNILTKACLVDLNALFKNSPASAEKVSLCIGTIFLYGKGVFLVASLFAAGGLLLLCLIQGAKLVAEFINHPGLFTRLWRDEALVSFSYLSLKHLLKQNLNGEWTKDPIRFFERLQVYRDEIVAFHVLFAKKHREYLAMGEKIYNKFRSLDTAVQTLVRYIEEIQYHAEILHTGWDAPSEKRSELEKSIEGIETYLEGMNRNIDVLGRERMRDRLELLGMMSSLILLMEDAKTRLGFMSVEEIETTHKSIQDKFKELVYRKEGLDKIALVRSQAERIIAGGLMSEVTETAQCSLMHGLSVPLGMAILVPPEIFSILMVACAAAMVRSSLDAHFPGVGGSFGSIAGQNGKPLHRTGVFVVGVHNPDIFVRSIEQLIEQNITIAGALLIVHSDSFENTVKRMSSFTGIGIRVVSSGDEGEFSTAALSGLFNNNLPTHIIFVGGFYDRCMLTAFRTLLCCFKSSQASGTSFHFPADMISIFNITDKPTKRYFQSLNASDPYVTSAREMGRRVETYIDGAKQPDRAALRKGTKINLYYWDSLEAYERTAVRRAAPILSLFGSLDMAILAPPEILSILVLPFFICAIAESITEENFTWVKGVRLGNYRMGEWVTACQNQPLFVKAYLTQNEDSNPRKSLHPFPKMFIEYAYSHNPDQVKSVLMQRLADNSYEGFIPCVERGYMEFNLFALKGTDESDQKQRLYWSESSRSWDVKSWQNGRVHVRVDPDWFHHSSTAVLFPKRIRFLGQGAEHCGTTADILRAIKEQIAPLGFKNCLLLPFGVPYRDKGKQHIYPCPYAMISALAFDPDLLDMNSIPEKGDSLFERSAAFLSSRTKKWRKTLFDALRAEELMKVFVDFAKQRPNVDDGYIKVSTIPQETWQRLNLQQREHLLFYEQFCIFEQMQNLVREAGSLGLALGFDIPFFHSTINAEVSNGRYRNCFAFKADGSPLHPAWMGDPDRNNVKHIEEQGAIIEYNWQGMEESGYSLFLKPLSIFLSQPSKANPLGLGFRFLRGDAFWRFFYEGDKGIGLDNRFIEIPGYPGQARNCFFKIAELVRNCNAAIIPEQLGGNIEAAAPLAIPELWKQGPLIDDARHMWILNDKKERQPAPHFNNFSWEFDGGRKTYRLTSDPTGVTGEESPFAYVTTHDNIRAAWLYGNFNLSAYWRAFLLSVEKPVMVHGDWLGFGFGRDDNFERINLPTPDGQKISWGPQPELDRESRVNGLAQEIKRINALRADYAHLFGPRSYQRLESNGYGAKDNTGRPVVAFARTDENSGLLVVNELSRETGTTCVVNVRLPVHWFIKQGIDITRPFQICDIWNQEWVSIDLRGDAGEIRDSQLMRWANISFVTGGCRIFEISQSSMRQEEAKKPFCVQDMHLTPQRYKPDFWSVSHMVYETPVPLFLKGRTFSDVTRGELQGLWDQGYRAIYLVGLWKKGPLADTIARLFGYSLKDQYRREDYQASHFAISEYTVDPAYGGDEEFRKFSALAHSIDDGGFYLVGDMVLHEGIDSLRAINRPDLFLRYSDGKQRPPYPDFVPQWFRDSLAQRGLWNIATARDDWGPAYPDCLQPDWLNPKYRQMRLDDARHGLEIGLDGYRVDFAGYLLKYRLKERWAQWYGGISWEEFNRRMPEEFYTVMYRELRKIHPGFQLIAESYDAGEIHNLWVLGLLIYDSGFKDNLLNKLDLPAYKEAIRYVDGEGTRDFRRRFSVVANHNEAILGWRFGDDLQRIQATKVLQYCLPWQRSDYAGESEWHREDVRCQERGKRMNEKLHPAMWDFFLSAHRVFTQPAFMYGESAMAIENDLPPSFFGMCRWVNGDENSVIFTLVNYGCNLTSGTFRFNDQRLPLSDNKLYLLVDQLDGSNKRGAVQRTYLRTSSEIRNLYAELGPFGFHIFRISGSLAMRGEQKNKWLSTHSAKRQELELSAEPLCSAGRFLSSRETASSDFNAKCLLTNGMGGYSVVAPCITQRHDGLLVVPATDKKQYPENEFPSGRVNMVPRIDDSVEISGQKIPLSTNCYPGTLQPQGYMYLEKFADSPVATFTFNLGRGRALIKEVFMVQGENTVVIRYRLQNAKLDTSSDRPRIQIQPLIACRDIHHTNRRNDVIFRNVNMGQGFAFYTPYEGKHTITFSFPDESVFDTNSYWYDDFCFPHDEDEWQDSAREDLFCPGTIFIPFDSRGEAVFIISTENRRHAAADAAQLYSQELQHRQDVAADFKDKPEVIRQLVRGVHSFIFKRVDNLDSVVAGWPWFEDWGRDTMIFSRVLLRLGKYDLFRTIMRTFIRHLDQGMLPNRFPSLGKEPVYDSVDASLWFTLVAWDYFGKMKYDDFAARELLPALREILAWYSKGTRFNIHEERDGLLSAGQHDMKLTWMDAVYGGIITPRRGKPVEVNALWVLLKILLADMEASAGNRETALNLRENAARSAESFRQRFNNAAKKCLFDVVDEFEHENEGFNNGRNNDAIRCNQLIAFIVPGLLTQKMKEEIFEVSRQALYTPMGIRSLEQRHNKYRGIYRGNMEDRDRAYHQGTVWGWWIGPFIDAFFSTRANNAETKRQAGSFVEGLIKHLSEGCFGHISEIADGDAPHTPRGCYAQAWSASELLRIIIDYEIPVDSGIRACGRGVYEEGGAMDKAAESKTEAVLIKAHQDGRVKRLAELGEAGKIIVEEQNPQLRLLLLDENLHFVLPEYGADARSPPICLWLESIDRFMFAAAVTEEHSILKRGAYVNLALITYLIKANLREFLIPILVHEFGHLTANPVEKKEAEELARALIFFHADRFVASCGHFFGNSLYGALGYLDLILADRIASHSLLVKASEFLIRAVAESDALLLEKVNFAFDKAGKPKFIFLSTSGNVGEYGHISIDPVFWNALREKIMPQEQIIKMHRALLEALLCIADNEKIDFDILAHKVTALEAIHLVISSAKLKHRSDFVFGPARALCAVPFVFGDPFVALSVLALGIIKAAARVDRLVFPVRDGVYLVSRKVMDIIAGRRADGECLDSETTFFLRRFRKSALRRLNRNSPSVRALSRQEKSELMRRISAPLRILIRCSVAKSGEYLRFCVEHELFHRFFTQDKQAGRILMLGYFGIIGELKLLRLIKATFKGKGYGDVPGPSEFWTQWSWPSCGQKYLRVLLKALIEQRLARLDNLQGRTVREALLAQKKLRIKVKREADRLVPQIRNAAGLDITICTAASFDTIHYIAIAVFVLVIIFDAMRLPKGRGFPLCRALLTLIYPRAPPVARHIARNIVCDIVRIKTLEATEEILEAGEGANILRLLINKLFVKETALKPARIEPAKVLMDWRGSCSLAAFDKNCGLPPQYKARPIEKSDGPKQVTVRLFVIFLAMLTFLPLAHAAFTPGFLILGMMADAQGDRLSVAHKIIKIERGVDKSLLVHFNDNDRHYQIRLSRLGYAGFDALAGYFANWHFVEPAHKQVIVNLIRYAGRLSNKPDLYVYDAEADKPYGFACIREAKNLNIFALRKDSLLNPYAWLSLLCRDYLPAVSDFKIGLPSDLGYLVFCPCQKSFEAMVTFSSEDEKRQLANINIDFPAELSGEEADHIRRPIMLMIMKHIFGNHDCEFDRLAQGDVSSSSAFCFALFTFNDPLFTLAVCALGMTGAHKDRFADNLFDALGANKINWNRVAGNVLLYNDTAIGTLLDHRPVGVWPEYGGFVFILYPQATPNSHDGIEVFAAPFPEATEVIVNNFKPIEIVVPSMVDPKVVKKVIVDHIRVFLKPEQVGKMFGLDGFSFLFDMGLGLALVIGMAVANLQETQKRRAEVTACANGVLKELFRLCSGDATKIGEQWPVFMNWLMQRYLIEKETKHAVTALYFARHPDIAGLFNAQAITWRRGVEVNSGLTGETVDTFFKLFEWVNTGIVPKVRMSQKPGFLAFFDVPQATAEGIINLLQNKYKLIFVSDVVNTKRPLNVIIDDLNQIIAARILELRRIIVPAVEPEVKESVPAPQPILPSDEVLQQISAAPTTSSKTFCALARAFNRIIIIPETGWMVNLLDEANTNSPDFIGVLLRPDGAMVFYDSGKIQELGSEVVKVCLDARGEAVFVISNSLAPILTPSFANDQAGLTVIAESEPKSALAVTPFLFVDPLFTLGFFALGFVSFVNSSNCRAIGVCNKIVNYLDKRGGWADRRELERFLKMAPERVQLYLGFIDFDRLRLARKAHNKPMPRVFDYGWKQRIEKIIAILESMEGHGTLTDIGHALGYKKPKVNTETIFGPLDRDEIMAEINHRQKLLGRLLLEILDARMLRRQKMVLIELEATDGRASAWELAMLEGRLRLRRDSVRYSDSPYKNRAVGISDVLRNIDFDAQNYNRNILGKPVFSIRRMPQSKYNRSKEYEDILLTALEELGGWASYGQLVKQSGLYPAVVWAIIKRLDFKALNAWRKNHSLFPLGVLTSHKGKQSWDGLDLNKLSRRAQCREKKTIVRNMRIYFRKMSCSSPQKIEMFEKVFRRYTLPFLFHCVYASYDEKMPSCLAKECWFDIFQQAMRAILDIASCENLSGLNLRNYFRYTACRAINLSRGLLNPADIGKEFDNDGVVPEIINKKMNEFRCQLRRFGGFNNTITLNSALNGNGRLIRSTYPVGTKANVDAAVKRLKEERKIKILRALIKKGNCPNASSLCVTAFALGDTLLALGIFALGMARQAARAVALNEMSPKALCLRTEMDSLFASRRTYLIRLLPGFTLKQRKENRPSGEDCFCYVQGILCRRILRPDASSISDDFEEVDMSAAVKGDLIVYYSDGKRRHYGIYLGGRKVESKFGAGGDVFRHPVYGVYFCYGDEARFFRLRPSHISRCVLDPAATTDGNKLKPEQEAVVRSLIVKYRATFNFADLIDEGITSVVRSKLLENGFTEIGQVAFKTKVIRGPPGLFYELNAKDIQLDACNDPEDPQYIIVNPSLTETIRVQQVVAHEFGALSCFNHEMNLILEKILFPEGEDAARVAENKLLFDKMFTESPLNLFPVDSSAPSNSRTVLSIALISFSSEPLLALGILALGMSVADISYEDYLLSEAKKLRAKLLPAYTSQGHGALNLQDNLIVDLMAHPAIPEVPASFELLLNFIHRAKEFPVLSKLTPQQIKENPLFILFYPETTNDAGLGTIPHSSVSLASSLIARGINVALIPFPEYIGEDNCSTRDNRDVREVYGLLHDWVIMVVGRYSDILHRAGLNMDEVGRKISFGVSIFDTTYLMSLALISMLRVLSPDSRIFAGGPLVSAEPELAAREMFYNMPDGPNCLINGEAELILPEVLRILDMQSPYERLMPGQLKSLRKFKGLRLRFSEEKYDFDLKCRNIVPENAMDKLSFYPELVAADPAIYYIPERGCVRHCFFCSQMMGRAVREFSAERILSDLQRIDELAGELRMHQVGEIEGGCLKNLIQLNLSRGERRHIFEMAVVLLYLVSHHDFPMRPDFSLTTFKTMGQWQQMGIIPQLIGCLENLESIYGNKFDRMTIAINLVFRRFIRQQEETHVVIEDNSFFTRSDIAEEVLACLAAEPLKNVRVVQCQGHLRDFGGWNEGDFDNGLTSILSRSFKERDGGVVFGLESGSDRALSGWRKGFTWQQAFERITKLDKNGVQVGVNIILSRMESTAQEVIESLGNLAYLLKTTKNVKIIYLAIFLMPLRGSDAWMRFDGVRHTGNIDCGWAEGYLEKPIVLQEYPSDEKLADILRVYVAQLSSCASHRKDKKDAIDIFVDVMDSIRTNYSHDCSATEEYRRQMKRLKSSGVSEPKPFLIGAKALCALPVMFGDSLLALGFLALGMLKITNSPASRYPDWFSGRVGYEILVDRFARANLHNGPSAQDALNGIPNWKMHRWDVGWYESVPWESAWSHEHNQSPSAAATYRLYGGDLQGVFDRLDYLKQLGIGFIYFCPIFWAPSHHKYDGRCLHHIDPTFGPSPEEDKQRLAYENPTDSSTWCWTAADKLFLKVVKEAHRRGIRVVLDGVFNHTGRFHFAFQDILRNKRNSRFAQWYKITSWDPTLPDGFEYSGWAGYKSLPEINRRGGNLNPAFRRYAFQSIRRWMNPIVNGRREEGVDGWRLDAIDRLPAEFLRQIGAVIKSANPAALIVGEDWNNQRVHLGVNECDSMMNYDLFWLLQKFFINHKHMPAGECAALLKKFVNRYPVSTNRIMFNLIGCHDTERIVSAIRNAGMDRSVPFRHFQMSQAQNNPGYDTRPPGEYEKKMQRLLFSFLIAFPGMPVVYYGDEGSLPGANDPGCRDSMPWLDTLKPGSKHSRLDFKMQEFYRKMIGIRNASEVLRLGSFRQVRGINRHELLVFVRRYKGAAVLAIINRSENGKRVVISVSRGSGNAAIELISRRRVRENNGRLAVYVPGLRAGIIQFPEGMRLRGEFSGIKVKEGVSLPAAICAAPVMFSADPLLALGLLALGVMKHRRSPASAKTATAMSEKRIVSSIFLMQQKLSEIVKHYEQQIPNDCQELATALVMLNGAEAYHLALLRKRNSRLTPSQRQLNID